MRSTEGIINEHIGQTGQVLSKGSAARFLVGVEAQSSLHQRIVEVVAIVAFVLLALVPFYVRRRMAAMGEPLQADDDGS